MMIKKVSSKRVVETVIRDFGIVSQDWIYDANEWVGNGLLEIGTNPIYSPTKITTKVDNYKVRLPCSAELFKAVYQGECRLPHLRDTNKTSKTGIWYSNEGSFLHFPFTGKEITLFYLGFEIDEEGYICIPDNVFVIEALAWKVMSHLLRRGMLHPTIDYKTADAEWKDRRDRASNHLMTPTPDEYDAIMTNYISTIPNLTYE